jgi:plasmid stabilization system protein ParE
MDEPTVYSVDIAPGARDRINDHVEFLARVSESAAERLHTVLLADIASLSENPECNTWFERPYVPSKKYRWALSAKRYRIIYHIDGFQVRIDDVQDCREDDSVRNVLT